MTLAELQHQLPAIVLGLVSAIPPMLLLNHVFKRHWMSWFCACLGLAAMYLGVSLYPVDPAHPAAFAFAAMRWFLLTALLISFVQFRRARRSSSP